MERPKKLIVWMWVVTVPSLLILGPLSFIAAVFSSDNSSGANTTMTNVFLVLPLLFLLFPITAHVFYRRGSYSSARKSAWIAIASFALTFVGLAIFFTRG